MIINLFPKDTLRDALIEMAHKKIQTVVFSDLFRLANEVSLEKN